MSYNVEEAVEDWVLSLSRSEMDSYLSRMELKRQGTLFRLCDRLSKWVLGIYVPQDFQDPTSPDEAIVRQKTLREELLRRIVTEQDGTFVKTTNWEIHPLKVVLKSEAILEILRKTTAEAASPPQHPLLSESPNHALQGNDDQIEVIQATGPLDDRSQSSETPHTENSTKDNQREGTRVMRGRGYTPREIQAGKYASGKYASLARRARLHRRILGEARGLQNPGQPHRGGSVVIAIGTVHGHGRHVVQKREREMDHVERFRISGEALVRNDKGVPAAVDSRD